MRLAILSLCLALAGCVTDQAGNGTLHGGAMASAAHDDKPPTHQEASLMCWMKFEHGRQTLSLDQRATLVDQCVKAQMKGAKSK